MDFIFSSVVLALPENTPSAFTEGYLKHNDIFEGDLTVTRSVHIPPLSQIVFDNGFIFEAKEKRTEIKVEFDQALSSSEREVKLEDLYRYARKFIEATAYLPYTAVGLNFRHVVEADGLNGVTQHLPESAETESVTFMLYQNGYRVRISASKAMRKPDKTKVVVFNTNHHKDFSELVDATERKVHLQQAFEEAEDCLIRTEGLINDTRL